MKKSIFTFALVLITASFSEGNFHPGDSLTRLSVKLHDGRVIDFQNQVKDLYFWPDSQLDYMELNNDEIILPRQIESLYLWKDSGEYQRNGGKQHFFQEATFRHTYPFDGIGGGG